ncbi:MAG: tripartite tricarboxylate transporter TctB family protein [Nitrospinota bacterium]|nr:tripartite tricarboxylate transporter TctB family protein [Nitrospinota bacterium]
MSFNFSSEKKTYDTFFVAEIIICAFIITSAFCLVIFMPNLIAKGGMIQAQDFIRLSPIFFPRLSFAVLSILGILYLFQILKFESEQKTEKTFSKEIAQNVSIIFILVVIYTFLLPYLGYGLASVIMIFSVSYRLGNRIWWQLLSFSFFIPLMIRIIFERILFIYLPRSHFEIIGAWEDRIVKFVVNLLFLG